MIMNDPSNLAICFFVCVSLFEFIEHEIDFLFDIVICLVGTLFPYSAICRVDKHRNHYEDNRRC